jgi:hypothetical protein
VYVPAGSRRRRGLGYTGLADLVVRWNRGRGLGAISSPYSTVADAVVRQEGYNSKLAPLNNPGNLIYAGQAGATPATVGGTTWASFPTYDAGYQALLNQIALDASRGLTISQFTAKYAPAASGNDPVTYAANIAAATGLSPNNLLSDAAGGSPYNFDTGTLAAIGDQTGGTFSEASLLDNPWALAVGGLAAAVLVLAVLE